MADAADDALLFLGFCRQTAGKRILAELKKSWGGVAASIVARENTAAIKRMGRAIFVDDKPPLLRLVGTPFQHKVWRALLKVPRGKTTSYGALAKKIGKHPRPVGSVGVARNAISYLVPCHRVLNSAGALHNYRWGINIKQALLAAEQVKPVK